MSHSLTKTSASIKETPQPDPPPLTTYGENYALPLASDTIELSNGELVNASGHTQTLERKFNLWDMCATAIVVGDCWAAAGGSIVVAIYNGGAPGVLYEFIVSGIFYLIITASLAELASAIPSSGGVYHWASVTPGRRIGRVLGFFAGFWNFLGWEFANAALSNVVGNCVVQLWSMYHEDYQPKDWHTFLVFLLINWLCCGVCLFGQRWIEKTNNVLFFFVIGGWFVTVLVCAIMPGRGGRTHASNDFVWKTWVNETGYSSNGLVFVTGMLNGAFAITTPDATSHFAEEIPRPKTNIPKAMFVQMVGGYLTTLIFLIALFYSISDLDLVLSSGDNFPLTAIYLQATGSKSGAVGLTIAILLPTIAGIIGATLTAGRTFWTLARDGATPFPQTFGRISSRWGNPFFATLFCGAVSTVIGCINLGSETAFSAITDSFVIFMSLSYIAALLPFLLRKRASVARGPYFIPGLLGYGVNLVACGYLLAFVVIYCFPYELPVTAQNMNYSSVLAGGMTVVIGVWWFCIQKRYQGPPIIGVY